jgi:hypothetical protein
MLATSILTLLRCHQRPSLTASPSLFDPGDPVDISLDLENLGTVPISGTVHIKVQGAGGQIVKESSHPVVDLAASTSIHVADVWDTTGLSGGIYRVVGQGIYASKTTDPRIVEVRARALLYLPCILRNAP